MLMGEDILNVTLRFWNGKPAWALALVVLAQAACLCGALYYLANRLLVVLGGE